MYQKQILNSIQIYRCRSQVLMQVCIMLNILTLSVYTKHIYAYANAPGKEIYKNNINDKSTMIQNIKTNK